jgi:energy-coupling factor transporter ATP-binding protein EcfA2
MRLQRVQIPNFRVLKDIDITFEDYHTPQIFLLASQNGGGKSTFLQLIFTLLMGCTNSNKNELIDNLLQNSDMDCFAGGAKLSTITLKDIENTIEINFDFHTINTLCDSFLLELDEEIYGDQLVKLRELGIDGYNNFCEQIKSDIQTVTKKIQSQEFEENLLTKALTNERFVSLKGFELSSEISRLSGMLSKGYPEKQNTRTIIASLEKRLDTLKVNLQISNDFLSEFNRILTFQSVVILSSRSNLLLISKITSHSSFTFAEVSKKISEHIFIAAPSSQIFLFLSPEELSSLFGETSNYFNILREKQKVINNLFLYEFSMVGVLVSAFGKALENDRVQAIRSGGDHGNEFKILFNDLKDFLNGKTIQPSEDMSEIIIKQQNKNNQEITLSPADLSHGELRRLSFYAWLKTNKIKNSVVLVDEIEIGLHPDWQYQIVRDLEKWEPSNQYILATHSYDICSALSPSHVKEIEPKLLKSEMKAAQ